MVNTKLSFVNDFAIFFSFTEGSFFFFLIHNVVIMVPSSPTPPSSSLPVTLVCIQKGRSPCTECLEKGLHTELRNDSPDLWELK